MSHQARIAFRNALAEGHTCTCREVECLVGGDKDCPVCTSEFRNLHPCPAKHPHVYFADGERTAKVDGKTSTLRWGVVRHGQCLCVESCDFSSDCRLCPALTHMCLHGRQVKLSAGDRALQAGYASGELPCPYGADGRSCTTADGRWYHGDCRPSSAPVEPTRAGKGRYRVGRHVGVTIYDEPEAAFSTLMACAQTHEFAERIVYALNATASPDAMIQHLVDSGLTGVEIIARVHAARQGREVGLTFVCPHHAAHPHGGLTCARCPICLALNPDAAKAAHDYSDVIEKQVERDAAGER